MLHYLYVLVSPLISQIYQSFSELTDLTRNINSSNQFQEIRKIKTNQFLKNKFNVQTISSKIMLKLCGCFLYARYF